MQFIKLQIGCLLVISYIEVTYIKATLKGKIPCNKRFDLLMAVAPWAVFFDGLTAWTVNHQDVIPGFVNHLAHLFFFVFMDLTIIITAEYMYEQLIGIDKNKTKALFLRRIPGALSLLLITAEIGKLGYIRGRTTWYSMGFSVYVCYGTIIFYYGMILFLVITRHRFLPKEKVMGTLSFILIAGLILAVQIRFPEVLLTSIFPTVLLLGIYIDFENPFIRKQTVHNEEMLDGFATMVENRDNNTGGHIKRTRAYVNLLLEKMRDDRYYRNILNKDYMLNVIHAVKKLMETIERKGEE